MTISITRKIISPNLSKYWLYLIVILLLCCSSCEEYFNPNLEGAEPVLVIEGGITNVPGPYTVNLSFSSGIYVDDQQGVENALVKIIEEGGEEEVLSEIDPGTYATSANGIQGTVDKNYKISILLQDGTPYESNYQKMPSSIDIDSVEAVVEFRYLNIDEQNIPGYQFYVTTELAENKENYFLWSLESTFKYRSDFTIDFIYTDNMVQEYPLPTAFQTCWRTDQVNEIYTFNTAVLSEPKVERLPINFARADRRELYIRYGLLVKQLTINKEAHTFWNNIQGQIENQENLYNSQPFQIRGNLFNIDDSEETVLGFFMVAAQNEKRIFVDPPQGLDIRKDACFPDYMSYGLISLLPAAVWPVYIYEDDQGERALSNDECFDCRERGGTLDRPDFWED
ncbi:MAG: hypothetical protein ACI9XB_003421 [Gammaproteobacteria bacterium]|jgi:hypothetical protein